MRKIIVAGGRDFKIKFYPLFLDMLDDLFQPGDQLIQGGCPTGVDALAKEWANDHDFTCIAVKADWDTYGRAAGPIRNAEMAKMGDVLVAFWDGKSRGTKSMIKEAIDAGIEIHVFIYS